jgi:WD40-like Beta Propeller Repeat
MRLPRAFAILVLATRLYGALSARWFEDYGAPAPVSPDGRRAVITVLGKPRIIDLARGVEAQGAIWPGLDVVHNAMFGPHDEIVLRGRRGSESGWFIKGSHGPTRLDVPPDAYLSWSPDSRHRIAYVRYGARDSGIVVANRHHAIPGQITGFSWLPDGRAVVVLAMDTEGISTLYRVVDTADAPRVVARNLDAPDPSPIAADDRTVYIALASDTAPPLEERHQPIAPRMLRIYAVALATGARHPIAGITQAGESLAPSIAGDNLYWTHSTIDASVVVLPIAGGPLHTVMPDAENPSWRPDGRQIGFFYGQWRYADWALDWDGGAVNVDTTGAPTSGLVPVITGYHEDFPPQWSPRGRWVAYHSHRPRQPVPFYDAPGSADDIWLRRVGAPAHDTTEIRLTDFGWEAGSPAWSPDGTRLVFTTWDRHGAPEVAFPWIVTIDTVTGRPVRTARLPLPAAIHSAEETAWSPRGESIALTERLDHRHCVLWIVNADGTDARKLLEFPSQSYGGIAWTPDARTLIYAAEADGHFQLFSIPASGGTPHQLTHDRVSIMTPRVSPNGALIAAMRLAQENEIWRMPLRQ